MTFEWERHRSLRLSYQRRELEISGVRFTANGQHDSYYGWDWMPGEFTVIDAEQWKQETGLPCTEDVLRQQAEDNLDEVVSEGVTCD